MNAIVDALRPFGVNDVQMPATPERVWRAIHLGDQTSDRAEGGTNAYGGASTSTSDGSGAEGELL
jgi:carbon-monoxide dehydrogenase large subunit